MSGLAGGVAKQIKGEMGKIASDVKDGTVQVAKDVAGEALEGALGVGSSGAQISGDTAEGVGGSDPVVTQKKLQKKAEEKRRFNQLLRELEEYRARKKREKEQLQLEEEKKAEMVKQEEQEKLEKKSDGGFLKRLRAQVGMESGRQAKG